MTGHGMITGLEASSPAYHRVILGTLESIDRKLIVNEQLNDNLAA